MSLARPTPDPTRPWSAAGFAAALLDWFANHGRHDLPWQRDPTPYRVWVSEIMLQQTQVAVVVPYFERFMARFPDLASLAMAAPDEVLHLWSGLGYYARARHLHQAAWLIETAHGGQWPHGLAGLTALPGIGRSTAGAIRSFGLGQREAILDGNCKRVLARAFGVSGWPGSPVVASALWDLAERLTPADGFAPFNQAMMDLGATCCTRHRPACERCPLAARCVASLTGQTGAFPAPRPRKALPLRETRMLLALDPAGALLLHRRPPSGLWGGLWTPPELDAGDDPAHWCERHLGHTPEAITALTPRRHDFTHFGLHIQPIIARLAAPPTLIADSAGQRWIDPRDPGRLGLPAPIRRLLTELPTRATI